MSIVQIEVPEEVLVSLKETPENDIGRDINVGGGQTF